MTPVIACFGPEESFSHLAARRRFGARARYVPAPAVLDVVERVRAGRARWGVVPFENVVGGFLEETLLALVDRRFAADGLRVCGEIAMRIDLALLGRGPLERVRTVYSHRFPLLRCREWLAERLPGARLEGVESTPAAAGRAARERGAAAVASRDAARRYGLRILLPSVGPPGANVTQFVIVGREPLPGARPTHTMLWFTLPHRPGALVRALTVFARASINLTRIASHPLADRFREYAFLVSLAAPAGTPAVDRALARLDAVADDVVHLGSYPVWSRV